MLRFVSLHLLIGISLIGISDDAVVYCSVLYERSSFGYILNTTRKKTILEECDILSIIPLVNDILSIIPCHMLHNNFHVVPGCPAKLFTLGYLFCCWLLLMQTAKVGTILKNSGNLLHDRRKNFENQFRNS